MGSIWAVEKITSMKVMVHVMGLKSSSLLEKKKKPMLSHRFFLGSRTGIRTPINWTRTSRPAVRRSGSGVSAQTRSNLVCAQRNDRIWLEETDPGGKLIL